MKKLTFVTAVSALVASPAFAGPVQNYNTAFASGTLVDPLAAFSVSSVVSTQVWYVDPLSGTDSNKNAPPIQKVVSADWAFDFTVPAAVSFTGELLLGDFKIQENSSLSTSISFDGRETYTGVKYTFSGVGAYDEATNTLTYSFLNPVINGGGAAVYSATAPASCRNGATSVIGKVCIAFQSASPSWEGLILNFVFSEDRSMFAGSLQGLQTEGTGLSRSTTTINWHTAPAVPVPTSAWLFGSGLMGLAGARRRRKQTA